MILKSLCDDPVGSGVYRNSFRGGQPTKPPFIYATADGFNQHYI